MKNCLIITPFYPFPEDRKLIQDTKAVYYLCKESCDKLNIIILYYYQHTRLQAVKSLYNIVRSKDYKHHLYKDDVGHDVLLFEHPCLIPHEVETMTFFDQKYLKILSEYLNDRKITIDTLVVHFPCRFSRFAEQIKAKDKIAILHSFDVKNENNISLLKKRYSQYEKFGYRSVGIQRIFQENILDSKSKSFMCLSGVPNNYINIKHTFRPWKQNGKLNIIFAGRLDDNKNVPQIINALNLVKSTMQFTLTIIGQGEKYNSIKQLVDKYNLQNDVYMVGYLKREEVFEHMLKADIFVMTSIKETLGISYLEAVAAGNLIVGSKGQGINGLIGEKEGCYFVNPYDVEELSECIIKINSFTAEMVNVKRKQAFNVISKLSESSVSREYVEQIVNV